jgi:alpha-glucosidase
MDVVHLIGKDFEDDPDGIAPLNHVQFNDVPVTHERLRRIRTVIDGYPGDRTSVGEVYLLDEEKMATYYGDDDELHMSFNFAFLWTNWDAGKLKKRITKTLELLTPRDATPTWVLSNHDVPRHRQRYGGSEAVARAAAVMLLTLPGTAFVYQGEELGLVDAVVPPERVVDPGGRDGCRAPIPWHDTDDLGWPADPWLPFPPDADTRNVQREQADIDSVAHLYRRLLAARRTHRALSSGGLTWIDAPDGVLAYERATAAGDRCWVIVNTTDEPHDVAVPMANTIAVSTRHREDLLAFSGTIGANAAVVLRPI